MSIDVFNVIVQGRARLSARLLAGSASWGESTATTEGAHLRKVSHVLATVACRTVVRCQRGIASVFSLGRPVHGYLSEPILVRETKT